MPYGWTGKLLRLNLTTKTASIEDNKYNEEWLGGMGLGYAIIHDEVPVGTDPAAPEMKMVTPALLSLISSCSLSAARKVSPAASMTRLACRV